MVKKECLEGNILVHHCKQMALKLELRPAILEPLLGKRTYSRILGVSYKKYLSVFVEAGCSH